MNLVRPILELSGLKAGTDFHLCFSPERVLPGRILTELVENDRVVGGITAEAAEAGRALYATFVKGEITLTDPTTAEMVKVMENTFRDVNIALANEFALISERLGINVWEAIAMANHHPRVNVLRPGPGVGGHCIAVDPWFLVEAAPEEAKLIHQARLINDNMPQHVMTLVREALPTGTPETHTLACFGLTFKADVDDTRESPALHIAQMLVRAGYNVRTFDPHVVENPALSGAAAASAEEALDGADLMLILVDHSEFKRLGPGVAAKMNHKQVIDTRNLLDATLWGQAGINVRKIGAKA
jgi:UDP-N-acetyl-D-mannosaminuronic acid dehydrogenase